MPSYIEQSATSLAQMSVDADNPDFESFAHFFIVSKREWLAICDRADEIRPLLKVNPRERAAWIRADRNHFRRMEALAFNGE